MAAVTLALAVPGMSYIAAVLLLQMDEPDAFQCLCNIVQNPAYFDIASLKSDHVRWHGDEVV